MNIQIFRRFCVYHPVTADACRHFANIFYIRSRQNESATPHCPPFPHTFPVPTRPWCEMSNTKSTTTPLSGLAPMPRSFDPAGVFEQQQQLWLSQRRRDKTKTGIEARGILIDWMGEHRSDACLLGNDKGSTDGISQEFHSDAASLTHYRYRQARQDDHRNRVLPHPFANALGRIKGIHLTGGQAEVAGRLFADRDNKRSPIRSIAPTGRGATASRQVPACHKQKNPVGAWRPRVQGRAGSP